MNKFRLLILIVLLIASTGAMVAQETAPVRRTLDIFYIDVEGGAATLIVTPAGESILVDAGWPGFEGRDAKRIEKAMKEAGVTAIDHLIVTHYHTDHYGGSIGFTTTARSLRSTRTRTSRRNTRPIEPPRRTRRSRSTPAVRSG
jgi:competence protein ComEC